MEPDAPAGQRADLLLVQEDRVLRRPVVRSQPGRLPGEVLRGAPGEEAHNNDDDDARTGARTGARAGTGTGEGAGGEEEDILQ